MRRIMKVRILVPLLAVCLLATFAVVGALVGQTGSLGGLPGAKGDAGETEPWQGSAGEALERALGAGQGDGGGGATDASGPAPGDILAAIPPAGGDDPSAHYLVRYGYLSLLVKRGTLPAAVDRVTALTRGLGGYVLSSSLGSDRQDGIVTPQPMPDDPTVQGWQEPVAGDAGAPWATVTARIPQQRLDGALRRLAELGDVQSVSTSSEDVTSQYVDLQARLRHYQAVEKRLLRFLEATGSIKEMLAVQDRIDEVQLTIEQLSAQLASLRETTTYATLTVDLREKGTPQAGAIDPTDTFWGTFVNSLSLLARGARATGILLTALLPFAAVFGAMGAAAWYATRRVRRGRGQPTAPPSLPA